MNPETYSSLLGDVPPLAARALNAQEALVSDARAGLTPAQMVERKLAALLQNVPLPVSRLQAAGPRRGLFEEAS